MIDRFLRRLSVRTRIVGGFLTLIALLTLSVPLSVANYSFLVERLRQVTNIEAGADRTLLLASTRIAASRVNLMRYVDNQVPGPSEALDDIDAAALLLTGALDQGLITASEQKDAVTTVVKALADYKTLITDLQAARQQGADQDTARVAFQAYRLGNDSGQRIEQIVKDSEDRVAIANASVETDAQARLWFLIGSYVVVAVLGLILTLLIQRSITQPVSKLRGAAEAFRQGRMDTVISVTGTDELSLLAQTFNQMTAQLSRLYQDLEQRVEARTSQLRTSADVGRAAASILDTDELLRQVVNLITDRFGFYYAAIFLADAAGEWAVLREGTGTAGQTLKERGHRLVIGGQSMVGAAMQLRRSRIALDVGEEAARFNNPLLPDTRSEIALPLVVGDRALGALDVQSTQAGAFDENSAAALQSMADQIAIALNTARQFQQTERALQRTNVLYAITQSLSAAATPAEVLTAIVHLVGAEANRCTVLLYESGRDSGTLESINMVATWLHPDYAQALMIVEPGTRFTPDQMPIVQHILPDNPLIVDDVQADAVPLPVRQVMQRFGAQAMIGLLLVAGDKQLGVLAIGYPTARKFDADQLQILSALARQAAIVLQNQQSLKANTVALEQLNRLNQRLIGQAWQEYTAAVGGGVRKTRTNYGTLDTTQTRLPSTVAAPVTVNGVEIGALRLEDATPDRVWTPTEVTMLQAIASEVSLALERARLTEETEDRARRDRTINRITSRLRNAQNVEQVLNIATQELRAATRAAMTVAEIAPGRVPQTEVSGNGGQPAQQPDHAARSEV